MIKEKLSQIYERLVKETHENIKIINECILSLESELLNHNFSVDEDVELLEYMQSKNMLPTFQKYYEIYETELERNFAKQIVSDENNIKDLSKKYPLYNRFVDLLTNEINLASIHEADNVLFIGSGPIPITAILLHELTGCTVSCCEKNIDAVSLSKKVINKLGYDDKIKIIHAEGDKVDFSNYSVILIALLAKPKHLILKENWNSIKKNVRIVCRTSDLSKQAFYETTDENLFAIYKPINKIFANGDQTISSVLLIK